MFHSIGCPERNCGEMNIWYGHIIGVRGMGEDPLWERSILMGVTIQVVGKESIILILLVAYLNDDGW